jgi:hypothetical protein
MSFGLQNFIYMPRHKNITWTLERVAFLVLRIFEEILKIMRYMHYLNLISETCECIQLEKFQAKDVICNIIL